MDPMSNDHWFIIENGSELGPYTWPELRDRVRTGLLTETTPLKQVGSGYTIPAGRLRVLFTWTHRERIAFLIASTSKALSKFIVHHQLVIASLVMLLFGYGIARHEFSPKVDTISPKDSQRQVAVSSTTPRPVVVPTPVEPKRQPEQSVPAVSTPPPIQVDQGQATLLCWKNLAEAHAYAKKEFDELAAVQPLTLSAAGEMLASVPSVCSEVEQRFRHIDQDNVDQRLASLIGKYVEAYAIGVDRRRQLGPDVDRLGDSDFSRTPLGQQLCVAMFVTIVAVGKKCDEVDKEALKLRKDLSDTYHIPFPIPNWIVTPAKSSDPHSPNDRSDSEVSQSGEVDPPSTAQSGSDEPTGFSRGSNLNDVEAVQGRPTLISSMPDGTEERYYNDGRAVVVYRNGIVESWRDPAHLLRVVSGTAIKTGN